MPAGGRGAAGGKGGARRPPAPKAAVPPACGRLRGRGAEVFPGRRRRAGGAEAVSMRATRRAPALKGASPACWGFPRPSDSPMFVAMWNPLSLLLTVLCFSLLGETVCLGRQVFGVGFCWLGASTACSGTKTRRKHERPWR
ncbi:hypothetical protein PVAP13_3NG292246 [Panicum virgatum]|uniref:Uncharacterized protein n=1 Tax=Panicum virgatum TaxID=38727 RepID=A0A8T0UHH6_PANVG|nr:hypothetical protein PVAP13_3NG292246 [Panicum virgatum]